MIKNEATKTFDELIAEERREYFKAWRASNKDKVRRHNQNFWAKKAAKRQAEAESEVKSDD